MKDSIIDKILHSTGYLPPRNEKEMDAFECEYSQVKIDRAFSIDVDSIVNDGCRYNPVVRPVVHSGKFTDNDLRMAARNFGQMPDEVIEKIKKQHKHDE